MSVRRPLHDLTPSARLDVAKRKIAEGVAEMIEATIALGASDDEWVDQARSPLGRRRHCELVRQGVIPGVREGRKVLVKRADLNEYLERGRVSPDVDDDATVLRAIVGRAS